MEGGTSLNSISRALGLCIVLANNLIYFYFFKTKFWWSPTTSYGTVPNWSVRYETSQKWFKTQSQTGKALKLVGFAGSGPILISLTIPQDLCTCIGIPVPAYGSIYLHWDP
jgi:hypothetical protein